MLTRCLSVTAVAVCISACATANRTAAPVAAAAPSAAPAGCVADTASRIPVKNAHDCAAFGRTWTDKDVKSTGATDVGQALSLLDTSVTRHP